MIRKDAWLQSGGMRERFNLLADIDLWMRLAVSWNVGYVNEPVIIVRDQRPSYYPRSIMGVPSRGSGNASSMKSMARTGWSP